MRCPIVALVAVAAACTHRGSGPPDTPPTHLRTAQVEPGMTLHEVLGILGPHAEINPVPSPVPHLENEVAVLWRTAPNGWTVVIFVPDKDRVLRVPNGTTFVGSGEF